VKREKEEGEGKTVKGEGKREKADGRRDKGETERKGKGSRG
jgi:hypothetical protein